MAVLPEGFRPSRAGSRLVRDYLDVIDGEIQIAFLPPYAPDLNPVEYLWAWLKRHAMPNCCPSDLAELFGLSKKYGEDIQVSETQCMHSGAERCRFEIVRRG